jgi:hypothetical protein
MVDFFLFMRSGFPGDIRTRRACPARTKWIYFLFIIQIIEIEFLFGDNNHQKTISEANKSLAHWHPEGSGQALAH